MADKFVTKACCGRTTTSFKTVKIKKELISFLVEKGFKEHQHFTKNGMLYVENNNIIISGQIGNISINVKCRKSNCDQDINDLELYLSQYEKSCVQGST